MKIIQINRKSENSLQRKRLLMNLSVEFKAISEKAARAIVDFAPRITDNSRFNQKQFYEYLDHRTGFNGDILWYGCFKDGTCTALSYLMKVPDDFILLAEIQSIIQGYGKVLIQNILDRSQNVWWCADPASDNQLVEYYRQFGLEEYFMKMSKWTNTPE